VWCTATAWRRLICEPGATSVQAFLAVLLTVCGAARGAAGGAGGVGERRGADGAFWRRRSALGQRGADGAARAARCRGSGSAVRAAQRLAQAPHMAAGHGRYGGQQCGGASVCEATPTACRHPLPFCKAPVARRGSGCGARSMAARAGPLRAGPLRAGPLRAGPLRAGPPRGGRRGAVRGGAARNRGEAAWGEAAWGEAAWGGRCATQRPAAGRAARTATAPVRGGRGAGADGAAPCIRSAAPSRDNRCSAPTPLQIPPTGRAVKTATAPRPRPARRNADTNSAAPCTKSAAPNTDSRCPAQTPLQIPPTGRTVGTVTAPWRKWRGPGGDGAAPCTRERSAVRVPGIRRRRRYEGRRPGQGRQ
jgi:hypothetical protein